MWKKMFVNNIFFGYVIWIESATLKNIIVMNIKAGICSMVYGIKKNVSEITLTHGGQGKMVDISQMTFRKCIFFKENM